MNRYEKPNDLQSPEAPVPHVAPTAQAAPVQPGGQGADTCSHLQHSQYGHPQQGHLDRPAPPVVAPAQQGPAAHTMPYTPGHQSPAPQSASHQSPAPQAQHTARPVTAAPPAARLRSVERTYGGGGTALVTALGGVDLDVPAGEFTAIMGPSGSGKSTLLHCLAGLDRPTGGQILVGGIEISSLGDHELTLLRRRELGFIFQSFNLISTLTAQENILLPFRLDGRSPSAEDSSWIDQLTQRLGLSERLGHRPHELSGGQQQRVAIVRALATRPRLVIADEPTGNLDRRSGQEVLTLLREAAGAARQTVVMVTHDPLAAEIADRMVFLADGRITRVCRGLTGRQVSDIMLEEVAR